MPKCHKKYIKLVEITLLLVLVVFQNVKDCLAILIASYWNPLFLTVFDMSGVTAGHLFSAVLFSMYTLCVYAR